MNLKKLFRIALIVVGVALFLTSLFMLFNIFKEDSKTSTTQTSLLVSQSSLMLILLLIGLVLNKRKYVMMRKAAKRAIGKTDTCMPLQQYLGRNVVVSTFINEFHGKIIEVQGNYIKIKDEDMREMYHILKSTMIISIRVK